MKKLILLLFLMPSIANSLPNTINEYFIKNPSWKNEPSSQNFLSVRCFVINKIALERIEGGAPSSYDPSIKELYKETLDLFSDFTVLTAQAATVSTEALKERALHWGTIYAEEAVSNWNNYNDMWHGDLGEDLMSCNQVVAPNINNFMNIMIEKNK